MWWPITGKVLPDGSPWPGREGQPRLDAGGLRFKAVPGDISQFNRRASADAPYDITALSVRAYADAAHRYAITSCGSSFGEGYGPKVVRRRDPGSGGVAITSPSDLANPAVRIAVPGLRTSAFMTLGLMLGPSAMGAPSRFVERPFDAIIPAVVRGEVDAGLLIHEGQVAFEAAGLVQVVDLGVWWGRTRGLPLPLGINAVKRDLDARLGPGTITRVADLLRRSLAYALEHRDESLAYTEPFARLNAAASGLPPPTRGAIDRYVSMYVTPLTADMGDRGRRAIARLLSEGAAAGLCPPVGALDVV
jgi:1,4-dihydroxy-6-naphthoate synthase